VQREIGKLRLSAARAEADLNGTLDGSWTSTIDDRYVLTISNGEVTEFGRIPSHIEDEDWYIKPDQTLEERATALQADADEAVATEAIEILRAVGILWPTCPQHCKQLWNCMGWWGCNGPESHDIARLGSLGLALG
jgi:hypothetical protein